MEVPIAPSTPPSCKHLARNTTEEVDQGPICTTARVNTKRICACE